MVEVGRALYFASDFQARRVVSPSANIRAKREYLGKARVDTQEQGSQVNTNKMQKDDTTARSLELQASKRQTRREAGAWGIFGI